MSDTVLHHEVDEATDRAHPCEVWESDGLSKCGAIAVAFVSRMCSLCGDMERYYECEECLHDSLICVECSDLRGIEAWNRVMSVRYL